VLCVVVTVLLFCLLPRHALATITTVPTSLAPGAQYRLAFVTSTTRDATSPNIDDYNIFVSIAANAVPELAALGTTWKAIASTSSVAARVNTDTVPSVVAGGSLGVPIFLLNGTKLVDSYDDLWDGSIDVALNVDEFGAADPGGHPESFYYVYTGSKRDGTAASDFVVPGGGIYNLWLGHNPILKPNAASAMFGRFDLRDFGWVEFGGGSQKEGRRFYALSAVLTTPRPQ